MTAKTGNGPDFIAMQNENKAKETELDAKARGKAAPDKKTANQDYASMTKAELLELAAEKGIKLPQRTSKPDVIAALKAGKPTEVDPSKPGTKTGSKRGSYNLGAEPKAGSITVPVTKRELDAIDARMKKDGVPKSVLIRAAIDAYLGL